MSPIHHGTDVFSGGVGVVPSVPTTDGGKEGASVTVVANVVEFVSVVIVVALVLVVVVVMVVVFVAGTVVAGHGSTGISFSGA